MGGMWEKEGVHDVGHNTKIYGRWYTSFWNVFLLISRFRFDFLILRNK